MQSPPQHPAALMQHPQYLAYVPLSKMPADDHAWKPCDSAVHILSCTVLNMRRSTAVYNTQQHDAAEAQGCCLSSSTQQPNPKPQVNAPLLNRRRFHTGGKAEPDPLGADVDGALSKGIYSIPLQLAAMVLGQGSPLTTTTNAAQGTDINSLLC